MTKFTEKRLKCEVLERVYETVKGDMEIITGKWDSDSQSYIEPDYDINDTWEQEQLYKREIFKEILKTLEKMC